MLGSTSQVGTFKYLILLWIFIAIHPKLLLCVLLERQRKESQMDPGQLSMVADKFQWVFSETLLNACGKEARFCRRQRIITPFRLGLALTATCASHRVETLADFHRGFNAVKPAAVERHTTMDLLCDTPTVVVLTPDTTSEQTFLPEPAALRASLLLADRGYLDLHYMRRVQDAGGFFLIRAKAGMNPQVVEAFREDGTRLRSLRNKPLKAIHAKLPKRQRVELVVTWQVETYTLRLRLLISWNRRTQEFCSLLTNLPAKRYHLDMLYRAYTWRSQVELLFKEWKSYANLHAFDTANPAIVEGLIWAAIAAAVLKRFLAYMTQLLAEVPMSTRKVAMCAVHVLGGIVQALKTGDVAGLYDALEVAITYLAGHAQRAHPERDRQTGRLQLGLEPLLESNDLIEFADAA